MSNPQQISGDKDAAETQRVEDFLKQYLPRVPLNPLRHSVCMYTMSPDEHFILDQHPETPSVVFAAGLSGHGFKFASVLGEVLVELALHGNTQLPIEFLGLSRFHK